MFDSFGPDFETAIDNAAGEGLRTWANPSWLNLLIVTPWVIGLAFLLYGSHSDRMIAKRQQTAPGTITAHDVPNHSRYGYTFAVNGQNYNGWHIPVGGESFEIGQHIVVYYDPSFPTTNGLTDFSEAAARNSGPVPLLVIGISGVAIFILRDVANSSDPKSRPARVSKKRRPSISPSLPRTNEPGT